MNGKSKPYAILVFGAPMSGKTTFAEQFSAKFNAPFLNFNDLREQCRLTRKVALILIEQLAKCKKTLVIEGGLDTEKQRNEIRDILSRAGYNPVLIWVQTDLNAIKQRMRKKFHNVPADYEDFLVISGKHMFQTQYKNVLVSLSERNKRAKKIF